MKQYLILSLIAAALLAAGCGALRQTPEEQARTAELVDQRLDARDYRIDVNYMISLRGGGKAVSGYSIKVDGTVIESHLPYAGVARNVPYGGGKVLSFEDDIDEYADSGWRQNGERIIVFSTNNDEDIIVYTLTLFTNGQADIQVHCRNRDDISFRGTLDTREESTP